MGICLLIMGRALPLARRADPPPTSSDRTPHRCGLTFGGFLLRARCPRHCPQIRAFLEASRFASSLVNA